MLVGRLRRYPFLDDACKTAVSIIKKAIVGQLINESNERMNPVSCRILIYNGITKDF